MLEFTEKLGIYAVATQMGKGVLPDPNPNPTLILTLTLTLTPTPTPTLTLTLTLTLKACCPSATRTTSRAPRCPQTTSCTWPSSTLTVRRRPRATSRPQTAFDA